jgi:hypothetical protein
MSFTTWIRDLFGWRTDIIDRNRTRKDIAAIAIGYLAYFLFFYLLAFLYKATLGGPPVRPH